MLQCRSCPTSQVRSLHVVVVLLLCTSIPCLADEHTHAVSGPTLRRWRVAFSSMHIHVAIAIVHANFQPCDNTFVASASCLHFNTCCDPSVCSVSSCPYMKDCLFLDTNLQQSECQLVTFERRVGLTGQTFSVSTAASIAYGVWGLEAIGAVEQKESGLWD